MTSTIVHQPRVAWDGALALVRAAAADAPTFSWCRDWVAALFGPMLASEFGGMRRQILDPAAAHNVVQVHEGLWRVRIEEALRNQPELAPALLGRIADTRARLG